MALRLIKALIEIDFSTGLADDEQPIPPSGHEFAHPIRELEQIVRDGCASSYTYQLLTADEAPVREAFDVILAIKEV